MPDNDQKRNSPENMRNQDIEDSNRDKERLASDEATIDLPDVKDIPGQEHVHVPRIEQMADTTISSDDEEGVGLFGDDVEDETVIAMGSENDITQEDKAALETMDNFDVSQEDDAILVRGLPDSTDDEGDELNERINVSGSDLDTAIVDEDDANENIGQEDEENNPYSLGSDSEQDGGTRG